MPTSSPLVIADVVNMVETASPHGHVLDVGPGWGKYATLLREYLNVKPSRIACVEAWPPYVERHGLASLYDEVLVGDVCQLDPVTLARFDVVLMVDVLEHIADPDAEALLARIPGRVVICTPMAFFHNGDGLPPTEEHRSHWPLERLRTFAAGIRREVEVGYTIHGGVMVRLAPLAR